MMDISDELLNKYWLDEKKFLNVEKRIFLNKK